MWFWFRYANHLTSTCNPRNTHAKTFLAVYLIFRSSQSSAKSITHYNITISSSMKYSTTYLPSVLRLLPFLKPTPRLPPPEIPATTFPQSLSLPKELQIIIWETAIREIINSLSLRLSSSSWHDSNFYHKFCWHYTRTVLRWRPVGGLSGGNKLWVAYLSSITTVCRKSHLVTCLVLERHIEGGVDKSLWWWESAS